MITMQVMNLIGWLESLVGWMPIGWSGLWPSKPVQRTLQRGTVTSANCWIVYVTINRIFTIAFVLLFSPVEMDGNNQIKRESEDVHSDKIIVPIFCAIFGDDLFSQDPQTHTSKES